MVFAALFPTLLAARLLIFVAGMMGGAIADEIVTWMSQNPRLARGFSTSEELLNLLAGITVNMLIWAYVLSFIASAIVSGAGLRRTLRPHCLAWTLAGSNRWPAAKR